MKGFLLGLMIGASSGLAGLAIKHEFFYLAGALIALAVVGLISFQALLRTKNGDVG